MVYINNERQTQQDRNKWTNDTKGDDALVGIIKITYNFFCVFFFFLFTFHNVVILLYFVILLAHGFFNARNRLGCTYTKSFSRIFIFFFSITLSCSDRFRLICAHSLDYTSRYIYLFVLFIFFFIFSRLFS